MRIGEILQRQDVRDLSEEQLYLFVEGLKRFQHVDKDDPLSYFQIAGEKCRMGSTIQN
jgi:tyrosinase